MKEKIITLPNIITLCRIPSAILVIFFFDSALKYLFFALLVIFDILDGYLARKLKQVSKLGGILDPLVDKICVLLIFVYAFVFLELPSFYIILFFLRDAATIIGTIIIFLVKAHRKLEIKARPIGKLVTALQGLVLLFMIIGNLFWIKINLYILLIVSIISIADYIHYVKINR